MLKKLALASAFVLCMTILSGTAWADNIPIVNSTFQLYSGSWSASCGTGCAYNSGPIPGWTGGGSWEPGGYFTSIPSGGIIGYTNAYSSISQTLTGNSVLANSVYTLSVLVGARLDGDSGTYTLSLDTILGGVTSTLCSFAGNASSIPIGTFQLEGCTYTSSSTVPSGDLYLLFTSGTRQLDVADASLTVQPPTTSVPEPSSVLLLSVGMLFLVATLMVRRKTQLQLTA